MTYALVPDYIVDFHRALLEAIRVDFFRPGMLEMNNWRDFLAVMKPLDDSVGGPFTAADLSAAINLMRSQNRGGANWSLRFAKIMQTPEAFRDLVLMARQLKRLRERPAKQIVQEKTGDGANVAVEHDPAAERDPVAIAEHLRDWRAKMKGPSSKENNHVHRSFRIPIEPDGSLDSKEIESLLRQSLGPVTDDTAAALAETLAEIPSKQVAESIRVAGKLRDFARKLKEEAAG